MRIKNPPVSPNTITSSAVCDVPKQGNKGKQQEEEEEEEQNMFVGNCRVSRVPVALRQYR